MVAGQVAGKLLNGIEQQTNGNQLTMIRQVVEVVARLKTSLKESLLTLAVLLLVLLLMSLQLREALISRLQSSETPSQ